MIYMPTDMMHFAAVCARELISMGRARHKILLCATWANDFGKYLHTYPGAGQTGKPIKIRGGKKYVLLGSVFLCCAVLERNSA